MKYIPLLYCLVVVGTVVATGILFGSQSTALPSRRGDYLRMLKTHKFPAMQLSSILNTTENMVTICKVDMNGHTVEGRMVISRLAENVNVTQTTDICTGPVAEGTRWKVVNVPYLIDPTNIVGMDTGVVVAQFESAVAKWNAVNSRFTFGPRSTGQAVDGADFVNPDGKNEILFGDLNDNGVVGVTVIWGIFSGDVANREIFETDMVFNQGTFVFGDATTEPSKYDFYTTALHELGHVMGLKDINNASCTNVVMYFSTFAGKVLRALTSSDILGICNLYV